MYFVDVLLLLLSNFGFQSQAGADYLWGFILLFFWSSTNKPLRNDFTSEVPPDVDILSVLLGQD